MSIYKMTPVGKWDNSIPDYNAFYKPVGLNIAYGKGITLHKEKIATRYPPGFPLIISASFILERCTHIPFGKVLQFIVLLGMSIGAVLIFKIGSLFLSNKLSLIASILWIIYPLNLWLVNRPLSESVFIPFLFLGVYIYLKLFLKKKYTALDIIKGLLAGIIIGISSLIRPISIFFGLLLVLLLLAKGWFWPNKGRRTYALVLSGMLLVGNLVSILPWELYVFSKRGEIIMLSEGGFYSVRDGITAYSDCKQYRKDLKMPLPAYKVTRDVCILQKSGKLNSFDDMVKFLKEALKNNTSGVIELIGIKAARAWFGTDSQSPKKEIFILLIQIPFLIFSIFGTAIMWLRKGIYKEFILIVWSIVFYTWGMTILVLSIVRYMVPAMGLLFIPMTVGIYAFWKHYICGHLKILH